VRLNNNLKGLDSCANCFWQVQLLSGLSGSHHFPKIEPEGRVVPAVLSAGERFTIGMKKILLSLALLSISATAGFAQESRQDVSASITGLIPPHVVGNTVQQDATLGYGALGSYRYMLTPRSALEANYQYVQDVQKYVTSFNSVRLHTRFQEVSAAYVYNFTWRNFNPFVEAGIGGYLFGPIVDQKTTQFNAKRSTNIGALYGAGIAYELSPSWDIRAEYRGIVVKAPDLGLDQYRTNRYYNINNPVIGVAYHF
jgi:outer membrane immunogenic protein